MKDEQTITEWNEAPEKQRFVLRNLSEGQRNALHNGSIGIGGLIAGAGLFSLFGPPEALGTPKAENESPFTSETPEPVVMYTDACFAEGITDDMSFSEAFSTARKAVGPGGFFEWQGNTYNTYYKNEWDQLTEADRQEYYASVEEATPPMTREIAQEEENVSTETIQDAQEPVLAISLDEELRVDVVAEDTDHDGFADIVVIDTNADGYADIGAKNLDENPDLDFIIIDEGLDGFDDKDPVYDISNEVRMDELIIIESLPNQEHREEEEEIATDANIDAPFDTEIDLDADTIEI